MNCLRPFPLLVSALIAAGAACPAGAQESIVFTKPPDDPAAKANSFMNQQPQPDSASIKMPAPLFNGPQASPDFDAATVMQRPQPLSPQQLQQQHKQEEERRNWGLMTPAEIFDVPTVAKIFGMPEAEADKDLTPEDRFLRRERKAYDEPATNSLSAVGGAWNDQNNPFQKPGDRDKSAPDENLDPAQRNRLFQSPFNQARSAGQSEAERRQNSIWQSVFSAPPTQPREDPERVAEMERFRTLLESQPALETRQPAQQTMPVDASFHSSFQSPAGQPAVPEYKAPTAYNAAANFEAQRQQEIGKPMGIAPLPPITAQPKKKDDAKPLVKPPPWLSGQPQPNTPPRWNF